MLMLDEPTASLDAAAEREVLDLLRRLNERLTIVLVTHDLGFISSAVTSVLCVNRRVRRHPTTQIGDITGELLESLFGRDRVMVRHDLACQEGGGR
jgi:zinc transport system ATP-binding protein